VEAGRGGNPTVRLKGRIALDVLNEDALPPLQGQTAGRTVFSYDTEMIQEILLEASLHDDLQTFRLRVVELDVAEVRMLQVDGDG
jgi:hypothetical protein